MPIHDWQRVDAGAFHGFHTRWLSALTTALNTGILPAGYFADGEQIARESGGDDTVVPDVVALRPARRLFDPPSTEPGVAVADAPPQTRGRATLPVVTPRRRHVVVRHESGLRVVALIEVVSPADKNRRDRVSEFAGKVADALTHRVHALVVDLFPPGRYDPCGLHDVISGELGGGQYEMPPGDLATLASYASDGDAEAYIEHPAVGHPLPDMPLFLLPDRYVNVPLEATYQAAWAGTGYYWRDILEGRSAADRPQD